MSDRALPRLLASARRELAAGASLCLATIVLTRGSTYRKAGARMLITPAGVLDGVLGGGCFDTDLAEQARQVLVSGAGQMVEYDMRSPDDAIWGLGLGCEGLVRVFLQPLTVDSPTLSRLEALATAPAGGLLVTRVGPAGHEDLGCSWSPPTDPLPAELSELVPDRPGAQALVENASGEVAVFVERIQPPPRLVLCGAGPDAVPVAALATAQGWRCRVLDHRPGYVRPERFPADVPVQRLESDDQELADADAVLIMSHSLEGDLRYLRAIADGHQPWVGVLGPTSRRERLLTLLGDSGKALSERLRGPVGLDLGGELPEEVALSIVAELQTFHYGRDAAALTGAGRK